MAPVSSVVLIISCGLPAGLLRDPVLTEVQLRQVVASSDRERFDPDTGKMWLRVEASERYVLETVRTFGRVNV